jgi:hypothetical protein
MRLWTLHPKYLDPAGLVALWRETGSRVGSDFRTAACLSRVSATLKQIHWTLVSLGAAWHCEICQ